MPGNVDGLTGCVTLVKRLGNEIGNDVISRFTSYPDDTPVEQTEGGVVTDRATAIRNRIARVARRLPPPRDEAATALLRALRALVRGQAPSGDKNKTSMGVEELMSKVESIADSQAETRRLVLDIARSLEYALIDIHDLQRHHPSPWSEDLP